MQQDFYLVERSGVFEAALKDKKLDCCEVSLSALRMVSNLVG